MADHIIEVSVSPKGVVRCQPSIARAQAGDRVVWVGAKHKGWFFREGPCPCTRREWSCQQILRIRGNTRPGKYKYSVQVYGKPVLDPEVEVVKDFKMRVGHEE